MSKLGKAISKAWGVEQSAVDNTPKISYVCGGELCIENHSGIEKITTEEIRFLCGIEVIGENLELEWIEKSFVSMHGEIREINLLSGK